MKIDLSNKKLLHAVDLNARTPDVALARLIHKSKEGVRYRIAQLQKNGIIKGFSIMVDPSALGFTSGKIYLKLINNPKRRAQLIHDVKKNHHTFWLGVADGAWDLGMTFAVTSAAQFYKIKTDLFNEYADIIIDADVGMLVRVHILAKRFLQPGEDHCIIWDKPIEHKVETDKIEQEMLALLFVDSTTSLVSMARLLNTTVDKIRSRLNRLKKTGVIAKFTTNINHEALGYEFYKTFLTLKNIDVSSLISFCKTKPQIAHIVEQISPWDIELESYCHNYQEYYRLIDELTERFPGIIKTQTAVMKQDFVFPAKTISLLFTHQNH